MTRKFKQMVMGIEELDSLADGLEKTKQLTETDKKDIFQMLASAVEELGELGRELKIAHKVPGNAHKKPDEGTKPEAVDLLICALCVFYQEGGTHEELVETLHRKLNKWESTLNKTWN